MGVAGACALLPNPEPAVVWRRREESAGGEGVKGEGGHATVRDLDGGADGGALASRHWKPLTPPPLPCSNHAKPPEAAARGEEAGAGAKLVIVQGGAWWGGGGGWRRRWEEACRCWEAFAEWAARRQSAAFVRGNAVCCAPDHSSRKCRLARPPPLPVASPTACSGHGASHCTLRTAGGDLPEPGGGGGCVCRRRRTRPPRSPPRPGGRLAGDEGSLRRRRGRLRRRHPRLGRPRELHPAVRSSVGCCKARAASLRNVLSSTDPLPSLQVHVASLLRLAVRR